VVPFTPTVNGNPANTGTYTVVQRPDVVGAANSGDRTLQRDFNVDAFVRPANFAYGNAGRNILRGRPQKNWDFVALKNFQYMLPLAVPLYCGAFLFPAVTDVNPDSKRCAFLARPITRKVVWGITILMFASQFIINLIILGLYAIRGR